MSCEDHFSSLYVMSLWLQENIITVSIPTLQAATQQACTVTECSVERSCWDFTAHTVSSISVTCCDVVLQVDIVRTSNVDFQYVATFERENDVDMHYVAVLRGFIHPLSAGNNRTNIKLYLIAAAARAYLYVSTTDDPQLKVRSGQFTYTVCRGSVCVCVCVCGM